MREKKNLCHGFLSLFGRNVGKRLLGLAMIACLAVAANAQEEPFNASEVGRFFEPAQQYADVWGDGNFVYIAHSGQRVVDIVDITDPANPVLAATYDSNVAVASAQDVKVHDGLMFVGLENASPGCQIVDVRDPYAPVKLTDVTVLSAVHNQFYYEGWLYLVDSSQTLIDIIDLRNYDPDNPPATISTRQWRITGVGNQLVHDITVQDGRMYASAWDSLRVFDVSDVANVEPPLLGFASGTSVHAAWPTDDGRFLVVGEEHAVAGLTLYEIIEGTDSVTLEARDYFFVSSLRAGSVHNPLVVGNRVYASWYASGIQVLEIDPDTATWSLVASFDTSPSDGTAGTFAGCWGVYPYLGEDKILASDRSNGLWVLDVDPNVLRFRYPTPLPITTPPGTPGDIAVTLSEVGAAPLASSVIQKATVNGVPAPDQTLTDQGNGLFTGTLPSATCGDVIELSFSADNTLGTTFIDPPNAPIDTYRVDVATDTITVFEDDFEADLGWTTDNSGVSLGGWERGDPIGTGAQPEFDATRALDGACFFTGQGPIGGSIGNSDVDGGPAILTSPALDFSAGSGLISYSYWLFNSDEDDPLVVEISIDGSTWIEVKRHEKSLGGWQRDVFHTGDFVAASAQTQIRFLISDSPNNSITEAAIDSVRAYQLSCSDLIFGDSFESGDIMAWAITSP